MDNTQIKLLIVDDEENIIKSLKRLFRQDEYKVYTANSGENAAEMFSKVKFDLVISDMRMPGMNGAELLEKVKDKDPSCVRILLTGYADMNLTIDAINKGAIYRYISKPWDDTDLRMTVKTALEQKFLQQETTRLEKLTLKQNEELKQLNESLEEKVQHRTKKLKETMKDLENTNNTLKKSNMAIIKAFSNLVEMRGEVLQGHSRRVAEQSQKIAKIMDLSDKEIQDIFLAGLLHDIGKVGLSDNIICKPDAMLNKAESDKARLHPFWGEAMLMSIEALQSVAQLVRFHHERFDGTGFPDQLSGEDIPLGSRIISVANEYDALQIGTIHSRKYSKEEAFKYIANGSGKFYDPAVVSAFLAQFKKDKQKSKAKFQGKLMLNTIELRPGMVISLDIVTKEGLLLIPKNTTLNERLINKIHNYERSMNELLKVQVKYTTSKHV